MAEELSLTVDNVTVEQEDADWASDVSSKSVIHVRGSHSVSAVSAFNDDYDPPFVVYKYGDLEVYVDANGDEFPTRFYVPLVLVRRSLTDDTYDFTFRGIGPFVNQMASSPRTIDGKLVSILAEETFQVNSESGVVRNNTLSFSFYVHPSLQDSAYFRYEIPVSILSGYLDEV